VSVDLLLFLVDLLLVFKGVFLMAPDEWLLVRLDPALLLFPVLLPALLELATILVWP